MYPDGRVKLSFKAAWKDGTHAVLLDPWPLINQWGIGRLCALIPPPCFHMMRYHGVLAGRATARAEVVPGRAPPPAEAQLPLFTPSDLPPLAPPPPPSRHPWPWLLKRVFAVDIESCPVPGCGGRMRLVEVATEPDDIARVIAELGGDDAVARTAATVSSFATRAAPTRVRLTRPSRRRCTAPSAPSARGELDPSVSPDRTSPRSDRASCGSRGGSRRLALTRHHPRRTVLPG